jgi:hypothetical protein
MVTHWAAVDGNPEGVLVWWRSENVKRVFAQASGSSRLRIAD